MSCVCLCVWNLNDTVRCCCNFEKFPGRCFCNFGEFPVRCCCKFVVNLVINVLSCIPGWMIACDIQFANHRWHITIIVIIWITASDHTIIEIFILKFQTKNWTKFIIPIECKPDTWMQAIKSKIKNVFSKSFFNEQWIFKEK